MLERLIALYRAKEAALDGLRSAIAKVGGAGYPVPTSITVARRAFHEADLAFNAAMKEAANA
jgi:hypothetical protein